MRPCRFLIFSFKKMLCMCSFTVPALRISSRAISLFGKPCMTSRATSHSRGLRILDQSRNMPSLKATTQVTQTLGGVILIPCSVWTLSAELAGSASEIIHISLRPDHIRRRKPERALHLERRWPSYGFRNSSGSLAMLAAIRRASSLISSVAA